MSALKAVSIFACLAIFAVSPSSVALAGAEYPECFAETPLPETAKNPPPPSANMPRKFAKWIGVWGGGKWKGRRCATLVVLTVNENGKAQVVYSWGQHPRKKKSKSGFKNLNATISDDGEKMEFRAGKKYTVAFSFDTKDGKPYLRGTISGGKSPGHATLWPKK